MPDGTREHDITATDLRDGVRPTTPPPSPAALPGEPREWDWDAGLSDQDRAAMRELGGTVERQRQQLERQEREIARTRSDAHRLREGLRSLSGAGLWRRRRVIALLRAQGVLD
jgi:hypothetical protein